MNASTEAMTKTSLNRSDADKALSWMLQHCAVACVSLGARGCVARAKDGAKGVAPAVRVPVVDTTGAGDSFTAGFFDRVFEGAFYPAHWFPYDRVGVVNAVP